MQRWKVRRARRKDGSLYAIAAWDIYRDRQWQGTFETWTEAMAWCTDPTLQVEYFANTLSSGRF